MEQTIHKLKKLYQENENFLERDITPEGREIGLENRELIKSKIKELITYEQKKTST